MTPFTAQCLLSAFFAPAILSLRLALLANLGYKPFIPLLNIFGGYESTSKFAAFFGAKTYAYLASAAYIASLALMVIYIPRGFPLIPAVILLMICGFGLPFALVRTIPEKKAQQLCE